MRRLRFRVGVRGLAALVALVALGLFGWRVYREGLDAHWMLLKLRFGGVLARRDALDEIRRAEGRIFLRNFFEDMSGPPSPQELERRDWRRRRAEWLLPAVLDATKDSDPTCRAKALNTASALASIHAGEPLKGRVFRNHLAAMDDPDESVRAAAMRVPAGLTLPDARTLLGAYWAVLHADPSVDVRRAAAEQLGIHATVWPEVQPGAAAILMRVLADRGDPGVRSKAIDGLWLLGMDRRRDPACPDVVPALVAALRDPAVEVRRKAADALGRATADAQGRPVSHWASRAAAILPAVERAMADEDREVRQEAALALFNLGRREPMLLDPIKEGAGDPDRLRRWRFKEAMEAWTAEAGGPAESTDPPEGSAR